MSPEVVALILVAAGLFVILSGGFTWVIRRMDERFDKVDKQFDEVRAEFNTVQAELNDVKVSVACLEGPQPRLIFPR